LRKRFAPVEPGQFSFVIRGFVFPVKTVQDIAYGLDRFQWLLLVHTPHPEQNFPLLCHAVILTLFTASLMDSRGLIESVRWKCFYEF
jgi:hypothetical protein